MPFTSYKTAVVGCGMISKVYMSFLQERIRAIDLVACCDADPTRARARAGEFGVQALSFEELLAREDIAIAINLTSPAAHYSVTRQLLQSGKHVYSEKMLANTLAEGKALCALAAEKNLRLGVAPDTFLGGGLQTARYALDAGLIGEVTSAHASISRDFGIAGEVIPHLLQKGGSVSYDVGCYFLTALAALLGPAVACTAQATIHQPHRTAVRLGTESFGKTLCAEEENIVVGTLRYASGTLASLHFTSECISDEIYHLELYGTKGILRLGNPNNFDTSVQLLKMNGGVVNLPHTHGFTEECRGVGATEMAWAITGGRPHRASMEMGCHVLEIVEKLLVAARTGARQTLQTSFDRPAPLPEKFMGEGPWAPTVEASLV